MPGPITSQPLDGLQVGQDVKGAVGDYPAPFAFPGSVESVLVTVSK